MQCSKTFATSTSMIPVAYDNSYLSFSHKYNNLATVN
jgi:hypothetical protein